MCRLGGGFRVIRGYRVWLLSLRQIIGGELARQFPGACYEPVLLGTYHREPWSTEFRPARCMLCSGPYRERPMHGFESFHVDIHGVRREIQGSHPYGWYAFRSLEGAIWYLVELIPQTMAVEGVGWVVGSCLLAGRVVVAERGYRAAHAAIEALAGPEPGAIFLMKSPRVQGIEELYDMLRQPPIVEMDWPFEADIPVWAVPDFCQQFDLALRRVRGGLVDIARKAGISLPAEG